MRYSSPSSNSSPDTHDYNSVTTTTFCHNPLYQTSPATLVLAPTILAPITANKVTKKPIEKKSTEMRSCAGARCTRFKHSSAMSTGMREWDMDGTTGWFLQKLIEVATTANELPAAPSGGMAGRREEKRGEKVGGMEAGVDVDRVREQLERLKTGDAQRKEVQVVKVQAQGEEVLAMAKTLESLTVSNRSLALPPVTTTTAKTTLSTTTSSSTLSSLPSNPFSALPPSPTSPSLPTIPPYAPLISTHPSPPSTPPPLSASLTATPTSSPPQPPKPATLHRASVSSRPYFPSSPVLSARRYSPSHSTSSSYPGYKGMASSSGSGSGIGRRAGVERVDRGKNKERVYNGQYTWSGYSSDGSYDHAPSSPSSSPPSLSYSPSAYSHSTLYSPSSPALYSSHSPFPSSSKVHTGRIGKRRAASGGSTGASNLNLSVGALASLAQGTGEVTFHVGMGVVVMGVKRVGRRAPSPEVQVSATGVEGVERKDRREMPEMSEGGDGEDVVMVMDEDMDMDGEWVL